MFQVNAVLFGHQVFIVYFLCKWWGGWNKCVFMMSGIEAETLYYIVSYWSLQQLCDVGIILILHLGIWASTRLCNLSKIVS